VPPRRGSIALGTLTQGSQSLTLGLILAAASQLVEASTLAAANMTAYVNQEYEALTTRLGIFKYLCEAVTS
jgi:hypothetical protein